jgi:hypothetical protein
MRYALGATAPSAYGPLHSEQVEGPAKNFGEEEEREDRNPVESSTTQPLRSNAVTGSCAAFAANKITNEQYDKLSLYRFRLAALA